MIQRIFNLIIFKKIKLKIIFNFKNLLKTKKLVKNDVTIKQDFLGLVSQLYL